MREQISVGALKPGTVLWGRGKLREWNESKIRKHQEYHLQRKRVNDE